MDAWMIYLILVNLIAFLMYGMDKWNAIKGLQRIPEKTLLGIAAAGGSVGAYAGMQFFRHKTRKNHCKRQPVGASPSLRVPHSAPSPFPS